MKQVASLAAAASVALAAAFVPVNFANAAQPPRVPAGSCGVLSALLGPSHVYHAVFWGQRPDAFDRIEETTLSVCFRTKSQCTAWLYWAQSDWQQSHVLTRCKLGL